MSYKDLRSISEFVDKTVLAIKAPADTMLNCDLQEASGCVMKWECVCGPAARGEVGLAWLDVIHS